MALSSSALSTAMKAALLASPTAQAVDNPQLTALCDCIASTVVAHIQAAAVVNVTVATTGTAAAQAGSGTGTVS